MKAHDLARELLECENLEVTVSVDRSTEEDVDARVFGDTCHGINNRTGDAGVLTILFE